MFAFFVPHHVHQVFTLLIKRSQETGAAGNKVLVRSLQGIQLEQSLIIFSSEGYAVARNTGTGGYDIEEGVAFNDDLAVIGADHLDLCPITIINRKEDEFAVNGVVIVIIPDIFLIIQDHNLVFPLDVIRIDRQVAFT